MPITEIVLDIDELAGNSAQIAADSQHRQLLVRASETSPVLSLQQYDPLASCENLTLTAALIFSDPLNEIYGYDATHGALSPDTFKSETINQLSSNNHSEPGISTTTTIVFANNVGVDFFTSIKIDTTTLLVADCTFNDGQTFTWENSAPINGAGAFAVTIC